MNNIKELNFNEFNDIISKNNFRINYYLGNVNKKIIIKEEDIKKDVTKYIYNQNFTCHEFTNNFFNRYVFSDKYIDNINYNSYFNNLYKYLNSFNNKYPTEYIKYVFYFGDDTSFKNLPCFIKCKCINNNDYSVLLKLNTDRHTNMLKDIIKWDIPFNSKNNNILWRGTNTGLNNIERELLVININKINNPNIDIKLSYLCKDLSIELKPELITGNMTIEKMLNSKFLLSIEGNDVATNLKWILLSNSVCLMKKPTKCSWFMEDMLIPFVHYVPLEDDFSDLEEKYNWCINHLDECELISKNATKYMEEFLDEENENHITTEVIKSYFEYVKFI